MVKVARNILLYHLAWARTPLLHMPFKISLSPKANAVRVVGPFGFLAKENS